jgi:hypothetical protein
LRACIIPIPAVVVWADCLLFWINFTNIVVQPSLEHY